MKIDLHRHLEGSHSPAALLDVAVRHRIKNPLFYDEAARRYRSPAELATQLVMAAPSDDASVFYQCIVKARAAYVSVEAIVDLATAAFDEAAAETDAFEMRLSLFSMTRTYLENQGRAWRDVSPVAFAVDYAQPILRGVIAARDEVQARTTKPIALRLGLSRTFESEAHYAALAAMCKEHRQALVGLDILGIVQGADTEPLPDGLVKILDDMRRDLPDLTIHAGEFAGPASVERTLALAPRGIGHGVRSLQSRDVLERLAKDGVTLEVCPSSNRLLIPTELARLEAQHEATPLCALQRAHVHCVLGSDDPTPMGTSFAREWELARDLGVDMSRLEQDIDRRWQQITVGRP